MGPADGAHNLILAPFDALLQHSSDEKTPSWTSKERYDAVKATRRKLDGLVDAEQQTIASTVITDFPTISSHINATQSLKRKVDHTSTSLTSLEDNLSTTTQSLQPLISLLTSRSSLSRTRNISQAHLSAYSILSHRSKGLLLLEEAIVLGRGAEDEVVKRLLDECGRVGNQAGDLVGRARVWSQLDRRTEHLRSVTSAQLTDAFDRSFSFGTEGSSSSTLSILKETHLVLPPGAHLKSSSSSSTKPIVPLPTLLRALQSLNLLQPALLILQRRLVKTIIDPLIASGGNMTFTIHSLDSGLQMKLENREGSNPNASQGLCDSLRSFSQTWGQVLNTEVGSCQANYTQSVADFTARLHITILKTSLDKFLIPRLPIKAISDDGGTDQLISDLKSWVTDIFSFVSLEKDLSTLSDTSQGLEPWTTEDIPRYGLVSRFYGREAGLLWANKQKQTIVLKARELIAGGWEGWKEVRVERSVATAPVFQQQSVSAEKTEEPLRPASQVGLDSAETAPEEDGWAFDDEWNNEESTGDNAAVSAVPTQPPTQLPTQLPTSNPSSEESGWSFDDDLGIGSKADSPPKVIPPAKPVREARKIGKKRTASNQLDAELPIAPSDPVFNKPELDLSASFESNAATEESTWSAISAKVPTSTPMPSHPTQPQVETCAVSQACSTLLSFIEAGLRIAAIDVYKDLTSPSFHDIVPILQLAATESLDIYRALMPVVHAKEVEDVPALAMQFANDCEELALHAKELQAKFGWNAKGAESRLEALSKTVQDRRIETQRETLVENISGANGFVNTSHDVTFDKATRVVGQAIHQLQMLHRQWKPVMRESACLQGSGILMEAFVSKMTSDIMALDDITANESERLDQLCKMLYPLEQLFTSHHGSRIVEYVPHWLKFCYVSELLTGSLVDITYLLETGALVDFTQSELVHIIVALFSDTPKRAAIIDKIWSRANEEV